MYSRQEVYESTLEYFQGDQLATNVWISKYALKDKSGNIFEKNPDGMHKRLAKEFARIENNYKNPLKEDEIYELLKGFRYIIPQGSPMSGIGNNNQISSISNCFYVDHKGDSYNSISDVDHKLISVFKRRGGCGIDISKLRPAGALVKNAALSSTGAVSFAERYSNTAKEVGAEGRRAALMISMSVKHPDIDKFIDAKLDKGKITGANISVKVTDEFIDAVKNDKDYIQSFPIDLNIDNHTAFTESLYNNKIEYGKLYDLQYKGGNEYKGCYVKRVKAAELWSKINKNAWKSAEPGILFWDNFIKESISDNYDDFKLGGVNPCAELSLSDSESCRLLAVNLFSYVKNPFTTESIFDIELFKDHIQKAQRMLDDMVDIELEKVNKIIDKIKSDPEDIYIKQREIDLWEEINRKSIEGRRTGLGITAEGDMLAALGLTYGTKEATDFSTQIHKIMAIESYKSSIDMAKERGPFSAYSYEKEVSNPFIRRILSNLPLVDMHYLSKYNDYGRRNIANLTIAPVGSVSILTQTTSGIEPVFMPVYKRRRKVNNKELATFIDDGGDMWEEYNVFHHKFIDWYNIESGLNNRKEAEGYLMDSSDSMIYKLIKESPYYKATSADVDYMGKVEMQGRIQKWIDHSISVTVNMPENVSEKIVSDVYMKAWESGCKGITVYREGSRSGVLISNKEENFLTERPKEVKCEINHLTIQGVKWIVIVGIVNNKPYEVFCLKNKELPKKYKTGKLIKVKSRIYDLEIDDDGIIYNIANEFDNPLEGALTRQISLNLKNTPLEDIYIQLQKEGGVSDFNKAISRVFKKYLKDKELDDKCPDCGNNLTMEGGCIICKNCGYSQCG